MSAKSILAVGHPLSENEFSALRQLSRSFARGTIAEKISRRLIALVYATDFMSNIIITNEGLSRFSIGDGRQR